MVFGEGIIERLPPHSELHNSTNPFRRVFINSVGALLDSFDVSESREGVYLQSASGEYLDEHGEDLGVRRRLDETDEHYRNRLVYETLGYLSVDYLLNVYDLPVYAYVEDYDPTDNTLTSDNPYISSNHMSIASEEIQDVLSDKFVIGEGIIWLTL